MNISNGSLAQETDLQTIYGSNLHSNQYLRDTHLSLYLYGLHLSPVQFLRSLTCHAAKLFQFEETIGTIAVGAIADLILLSSNPLIDSKWCSSEESICAVIQVPCPSWHPPYVSLSLCLSLTSHPLHIFPFSQRGRIKKLLRGYREGLYLFDEETQETTPMMTQEAIGKKFTYSTNSNTLKKKPWKPPGPLLQNPTGSPNIHQATGPSSGTSITSSQSTSSILQRSLSSLL
jgi:hypothetical protein